MHRLDIWKDGAFYGFPFFFSILGWYLNQNVIFKTLLWVSASLHHVWAFFFFTNRVCEILMRSSVTGDKSDMVSSATVASSCRAHAGVAGPVGAALARRLRRDSPVAAPGSSPPAGIPSASFAPRCSRDAPPPTHGSHSIDKTKKKRKKRARWYADDPLDGNKEKKKKKAVATTQAKASIPKTQRWMSIVFFLFFFLSLKHDCRESWLKQRRKKMEATKGQNERGGELLQRCQVWAPARRAMQLSRGGRTARAESQSKTRPPQNTNKRNEWNLLSTGVGGSCDAPWDYLPKNGVHVLEFSFHNKVIIIGGGRGAGVRLRGRGRGEGHVEKRHDMTPTCTLTHQREKKLQRGGHLWECVSTWGGKAARAVPTFVRAAILCASSASTSGSVSAFRIVCCSFCSASSSLSCSCLFFSSICRRHHITDRENQWKALRGARLKA